MTADFDSRTTRLPTGNRCPYCEARLDAASHTTEKIAPKPGDLTVCMYCASVLVFDPLLVPSKPMPGEIEATFAKDKPFADEVRRIQRAVRALDRRDLRGTAKP